MNSEAIEFAYKYFWAHSVNNITVMAVLLFDPRVTHNIQLFRFVSQTGVAFWPNSQLTRRASNFQKWPAQIEFSWPKQKNRLIEYND